MKNERWGLGAGGLLVLAAIAVGTSCATPGGAQRPAVVSLAGGGVSAEGVDGYLKTAADSRRLLPPPPSAGSIAFEQDKEANEQGLALRGSPRWAQATEDANLTFPRAAGTFDCALGASVTEQGTPHLYTLLRRVMTDASASTAAAKGYYHRTRPFVFNGQPSCAPGDEEFLKNNGSYPSGHSAIGWAWALVLVEVNPERTDEILARGRAFGQSRVVCNVHWQSDVDQGRVMGAATVARLHAEPAFRLDLEAAEAEFRAVRPRGVTSGRDCAAESGALER